ncbi:hypothetical protein ACSZNL_01095 [Aeromonas jandaei]
MTDPQQQTISCEIDLKNQKMIAISDGGTPHQQDIAKRIVESVSKSLRKLSSDWINLFEELIEHEKFEDAYEIFEKNSGTLQFTKSKASLTALMKMDVSKLHREHRKEYLIFLVAYSSYIGDRSQSPTNIDLLLNEYQEELEPLLVQNLLLEKANTAAISGFINKAYLIYQKIISSSNSDAGTIAYAYQGLSNIAEAIQDKIYFAEKAVDKHLESGSKSSAVNYLLLISDLKSTYSPTEALQAIDKCIRLYDSERLMDRELLASLKHTKAAYLNKMRKREEALPYIEEACELRRGLIGNELEFHSSLMLASIISKENGDDEKSNFFREEAKELALSIDDETFRLSCEISALISQKMLIDESTLSRIILSGDARILSATLLYQSTNDTISLDDAMDFLDKARVSLEENNDNQMLDTVYFMIAEKYRTEGLFENAFKNYQKSLEINPFYYEAAQNYAATLFSEKLWYQAESFIKGRIELLGELPGNCFYYARCLFEDKKYLLALKYFQKSMVSIPLANEYIQKCLEQVSESDLLYHTHDTINSVKTITADQFYESLKEFSMSISADSRMHFWEKDKTKNEYKWTSKPEELSKQMLITFLNGKFGKGTIEIIQEPRAGAGFIDLYVLLPGGLRVVIELKMCGCGYSSTYAISGESQIIHYQKNTLTNLGYLVVFDARKNDYGKHFNELQMVDNHTIYTVAVDMRPGIDKSKN